MVENKASVEWDHRWKADKKLVQANSKITELKAKLPELQQELTVLQMQDKRMPIAWDDPYSFSGSDSEPTSGRLSWKRKKGPGIPTGHQLWGLLPEQSQYVSTGWWTEADDASIIIAGSRVIDHTAFSAPAHIKDRSSMGEEWPPNFGNRSVT